MSRNWSAVLLLGVALALSWLDSTASFSLWPVRVRVESKAARPVRIPPPPGAWVQVGDDYLSKEDILAFVGVPEVQDSPWADVFQVVAVRNDEDLRRAARLTAAVHLAASEAERHSSLVRQAEEHLGQTERQWLIDLLEQAIVDSVPEPTTDEVHAEYQRRLPSFTSPETRTCQHVFFSSQTTVRERRRKSPKLRADEALKKLREGQDFRQLVKDYSDSSSASQEGLLTNVHPEDVLAEFADALWKLSEGEISGPVKVGDDYHLIRLLTISATREEPFEAHREELAQQLYATRLEEARRRALEEAERLAGARFHPEGLASDATPGALIYRVEGQMATAADCRRWLDSLSPDTAEYYASQDNRERYYRQEYERGLLLSLARNRRLDESPDFLPRKLAVRQLRLAEALLSPVIRNRAEEKPVPEETLRAYHREHRGRFVAPLSVAVDQIHVGWAQGKGSEEERLAAAATRVDAVAAKLNAGASRRDVSQLPEVSWYSLRRPQEFDALPETVRELLSEDLQYSPLPVLDATSGALYGPVRESNHFLLVRVTEIVPARNLDYEECRDDVLKDYYESLEPDLLYYELEKRLKDADFHFLDQPESPA